MFNLHAAAAAWCLQADAAAVAGVHDDLAAARQELAQLQLDIQQLLAQAAADRKAIGDMKRLQMQPSQQQQLGVNPASMPGQVATSGAAVMGSADKDTAAQLQQLPLLLLRLAAIERSLAGAAAAPQPAAAAPTRNSSTNGNSSRAAIESGSGGDGTLMASLAAQVASLQEQVAQLLQGRVAGSRSNSVHRPVMSVGGSSLHLAAAAEAGSCAATGGAQEDNSSADGAAPTDAGAAAADAAGVAEAGVMAALSELAERVVELQAQLDGLSAAKADRGELERLRGLLAETAAQVGLLGVQLLC